MKKLVLMLALACAGCAGGSNAPLPAGPDTYTLSERIIYAAGGSDRAQQIVLTRANEHCESMGRKFAPTIARPTWNGIPGYEVTYSCLLIRGWPIGE